MRKPREEGLAENRCRGDRSEERELLVRVAGKYSGVGMVWEGAAVGKLSSGLRDGQTLRLNASAVSDVC